MHAAFTLLDSEISAFSIFAGQYPGFGLEHLVEIVNISESAKLCCVGNGKVSGFKQVFCQINFS